MDANCHHTGEAGGGSGETRSGMNSEAEPLAEAPSGTTVRQGQPVTHRQTGRGLQRPHPLQQGGSPPPYLPSPRGAPGLCTDSSPASTMHESIRVRGRVAQQGARPELSSWALTHDTRSDSGGRSCPWR